MLSQLGIAAGGLIKQHIRKDTRDPKGWVKGLAIPFRVQILDSSTFRQVTGKEPPACPNDAEAVSLPQKLTTTSVFFPQESPVTYPYTTRKS